MASRTTVARNWASNSENRIHADDVAQAYGFRGGLVPGVTLFAYLVPPLVEDRGEAWLSGGWAEVRFVAPVYEGETVTATAEAGDLRLDGPAGACVTGQAWTARAGVLDRVPKAAPLPETRPAASDEALALGTRLGSLVHAADPDRMAAYLTAVGEDPEPWLARGVAHPGWLLLDANEVLVRNVVLGPWIHVGSAVRTLAPVALGSPLEVRAEVTDAYERKGHHLVDLEVVTLAAGVPAFRVRHTAIWQLREPANA